MFSRSLEGKKVKEHIICAIGSINSHYFHIIGDGKNQPNNRVLYTNYKDSVIKGGRFPIPNKTRLLTMAQVKIHYFFFDEKDVCHHFFLMKTALFTFLSTIYFHYHYFVSFFFPAVSKPLFLSDGRFEAVPTQPGIRVKRTARVEFFDL